MSRTYIPGETRQRVRETARHRCGYCQTQELVVGYPLHIEHIIPEAAGGSSQGENLWLACSVCNNYKGTQVVASDPVSAAEVSLFNPRAQRWSDHFAWSDDGTRIEGLTPEGRATVTALQLNAPFRVHARQRWVSVGWHPPGVS